MSESTCVEAAARPTASSSAGYQPAGYRSPPSEGTISSLSSGGLTDDTEFGSLSPDWMSTAFPDLAGVFSASTQPPRFSPTMFLEPLGGETGDEGASEEPVEPQAGRDVPPPVCDAEVDARPLPPPFLEAPQTPTSVLATHTAALLSADLFAGPHSIAEGVIGLLPTPPSRGERRAIHLAVTFSAAVTAQLSTRLLNDIHVHFGTMDMIEPAAILRFICEHVESWRRRPTVPEDAAEVFALEDD